MEERSRLKNINLLDQYMCIENYHNRVRATSRYNINKLVHILLKAAHKLAKDWKGQPFTSLLQAYHKILQACDKPTESCFLQVNFRLYWIQENMIFVFKNYISFIVLLIFFILNANYLCFIFGVFKRFFISISSVFSCGTLFFSLQNFQFIQFIEQKFQVVTYDMAYNYLDYLCLIVVYRHFFKLVFDLYFE